MNRPDFDEFAALWQGEPNQEEQARLEALARVARRRGRLLAYADYAVWTFMIGLFVFGTFMSKTPLSLGLAIGLMIVTTWVTWKRRGLRQMVRTLYSDDRSSFIDNSIANVRANLRRGVFSLGLLAFVVPFAIIFKVSIRTGGGPREVLEAFVAWFGTIRAPITLSVVFTMAAYVLYQRRKLKSELRRLEALRQKYEAEERRDSEEGHGI